jgi:hypothetical protein
MERMKLVFLYIGVERVRMAYMGLQWGMGELLGWVVWSEIEDICDV